MSAHHNYFRYNSKQFLRIEIVNLQSQGKEDASVLCWKAAFKRTSYYEVEWLIRGIQADCIIIITP